MNTSWVCNFCKRTERTSPHVKAMAHVHGNQQIELIPYRKEIKRNEISVKKLTKDLDDIFSEYIRRSASDENGYCRCVTCRKIGHWKAMQAGHFISRAKKGTRFDEKNVHVQCPICNGFGHGMLIEYKQFLIDTYGPNIINELEYKAKGGGFNVFALQSLIKLYQNKLKELK